jgi:hypothetical protein
MPHRPEQGLAHAMLLIPPDLDAATSSPFSPSMWSSVRTDPSSGRRFETHESYYHDPVFLYSRSFHDNFFPLFALLLLSKQVFLVSNTIDYSPRAGKVHYVDLKSSTPNSEDVATASFYVNPSSEMSPATGRLFSLSVAGFMHALEEESSVSMHHDGPRPKAGEKKAYPRYSNCKLKLI